MKSILISVFSLILAIIIFIIICISLFLYVSNVEDVFGYTKRCNKYTTSKGEIFYVKSINWGITGNSQLSIVTKDYDKLEDGFDTINSTKGLEPFFYKYKNDTLILIFKDTITYKVKESFNTLHLKYIIVDYNEYWEKYCNKNGFQSP